MTPFWQWVITKTASRHFSGHQYGVGRLDNGGFSDEDDSVMDNSTMGRVQWPHFGDRVFWRPWNRPKRFYDIVKCVVNLMWLFSRTRIKLHLLYKLHWFQVPDSRFGMTSSKCLNTFKCHSLKYRWRKGWTLTGWRSRKSLNVIFSLKHYTFLNTTLRFTLSFPTMVDSVFQIE